MSPKGPPSFLLRLSADRARLEVGPTALTVRASDEDLEVIVDGVLFDAPERGEARNVAETARRLYKASGEKALAALRGAFVVAAWDRRRRTLVCARDQMGLHPLFYAEGSNGDLFLADTIDTLLGALGGRSEVNRPLVAQHILGRSFPSDETYFSAVRRVVAGHALTHDGTIKLQRYWDPGPPATQGVSSDADLYDSFEFLLLQAVDRCLTLGPAAVYLSGGIDSGSVVAAAAERSREHSMPAPLALSVIFPDRRTNEESNQRAVASALGLPQAFERLTLDSPSEPGVLDLAASSATPVAAPWASAYFRLAREAIATDRRVILTGDGGDEWLLPSLLHAADLLRGFRIRQLYRLSAARREYWRGSRLSILRDLSWSYGARPVIGRATRREASRLSPSVLSVLLDRRKPVPSWLAPDPELRHALRERALHDATRRERGSFHAHDRRETLANPVDSMYFEDRFVAGRREGVHYLAPYWDVDLVTFLYRTPPDRLDLGGRAKGLARQLLERRLPSYREWTNASVTTSFLQRFLGTRILPAWSSSGGARVLSELGIVDERAAEASLLHPTRMWAIVRSEVWLRARLEA